MKLIDRFMITTSYQGIPWKIYNKETHRLLCKDYGNLRGDSKLDDMNVWSISIKRDKDNNIKYLRVSVH